MRCIAPDGALSGRVSRKATRSEGLLSEFGIVFAQGAWNIESRPPRILEDAENGLTGGFRELLLQLLEHMRYLHEQEKRLEAQIKRWHDSNEASSRIAEIPGIGPLTASALIASIWRCPLVV